MDEKLVTFLIRFICEEKHPNKINEKQKFLKYRKENSIGSCGIYDRTRN